MMIVDMLIVNDFIEIMLQMWIFAAVSDGLLLYYNDC